MINPEIDQSDIIYSNGTKTRQKISESRDEHIFLKSNIDSNRRKTYSLASKTSSEFRDKHFCADNYFPELLQRNKLCGNDTRVFIIKRKTLLCAYLFVNAILTLTIVATQYD